MINNPVMKRGCRCRPVWSIFRTEATGNSIKARRSILPARWTYLDSYGDGRLEPGKNLVISSLEIGVHLLTRIAEWVTTPLPNSEQYHLLQIFVVERICPLSVVIALRYAGATVTATDTPIHEDSVGGTLRDFRSTQDDCASSCKGAYHIPRGGGAGHRWQELIALITHPYFRGGRGGWDRRVVLVVSPLGSAKGHMRCIILRGGFNAVVHQQPGIDCWGVNEDRWSCSL